MLEEKKRNGTNISCPCRKRLDFVLKKYKTRVRDSEQVKTTFGLYNQDAVQKGEPTACTRLKQMVKMYLEQDKGSKLRCWK